jgi:endonuclease YncB( thermonuclease family)
MGLCKSKLIPKECTDELQTRDFLHLKPFTFNGIIIKCKVQHVYDGDTVSIVFNHRGIFDLRHLRMYGYDSPEMKPLKTIENRELHIQAAHKCRDIMIQLVQDKIFYVHFMKEDKYGRLLGHLYPITNSNTPEEKIISINTQMIQNGFGKEYQGGKKIEFTKYELEKIINSSL